MHNPPPRNPLGRTNNRTSAPLSSILNDADARKKIKLITDYIKDDTPKRERWWNNLTRTALMEPSYILLLLAKNRIDAINKVNSTDPFSFPRSLTEKTPDEIRNERQKKIDEINKAYDDLEIQLNALQTLKDQDKAAKPFLEQNDSQYTFSVSSNTTPSQDFINKYGNGKAFYGPKLEGTFDVLHRNVRPKFTMQKNKDGRYVVHLHGYNNLPLWGRSQALDKQAEALLAIYGKGATIRIEDENFEKLYTDPSSHFKGGGFNLPGNISKKSYCNKINNFALSVYSKGMVLDTDQFRLLDDQTQSKCLKLLEHRNAQRAGVQQSSANTFTSLGPQNTSCSTEAGSPIQTNTSLGNRGR